ncbi:hypothetical protein EQM14_08705 [Caproiciproducens sp. NJN-50]|uniref:hypothetical protein n=1 Tax=Acutalibacteraceae TaxID=3082771 RepID=UPI000FFE2696|nr:MULTISPECIES: hypothetical protein [Acutalibacteraceae]QAT49853.1 hypothetical protein EQM14_08705 [Caproiciproducens sp. NJN-50]
MEFDAVMKRAAISATVDLSLHGIVTDPRRSMKNAVDLFSYLTEDIFGESIISKVRQEAKNPRSCFYRMITSMVQNVDHSILKEIGTNMCFNRAAVLTDQVQEPEAAERKNLWRISPENLCEAVEFIKKEGVYFFVICGLHPLRYQDKIFEACRKNHDCVFYITSEGCDISDSLAQKIIETGNIILSVRINTFADPEKMAEGCGRSFHILKSRKCLFGYIAEIGSPAAKSCCSDGFINCMANYGCLFGWYYISKAGQKIDSCRLAVSKLMNSSLTSRSKPLLLLSPETDRMILKRFVTGGRCYLIDSSQGIRCRYCTQKAR